MPAISGILSERARATARISSELGFLPTSIAEISGKVMGFGKVAPSVMSNLVTTPSRSVSINVAIVMREIESALRRPTLV